MINPQDIQQDIYDNLQNNMDAKTFIQNMYDGIKHEYTGTIEELRQRVKLGFLKWINEL